MFCNERKFSDEAEFRNGVIGFCKNCGKKLPRTAECSCFEGTFNIDYILSPLFYTDEVKRTITEYKFKGYDGYGEAFAHITGEFLRSYDFLKEFDAVVAVPISKIRMKERGFNQSEIIAKSVSDTLNVSMRGEMIKKVRETKRQSELKASERFLNVQNAYWADAWLSGKKVLLVDDICTTGTTLEECAKTIKKGGTGKVVGITLALKERKKARFNV